MTARAAQRTPLPVALPLAVSLAVTAVAAAYVCTPPHFLLHSWSQVFTRATLYLAVACCVHALAVWAVCAGRKENEGAGLPLILPVIWSAWIVVVWLPLISLLTAERSPWVAAILPVTAIFAMLLLRLRSVPDDTNGNTYVRNEVVAPPFQLPESPPLWRMLLPAAVTALAAQGGVAELVEGHAWIAGLIFSAGVIYPVERLLDHPAEIANNGRERGWRQTAAGNSLIVWLLILLALVPFMAAYARGEWIWLLGTKASSGPMLRTPSFVQGRSSGYTGIILVQPKKSHEIAAPAPMSTTAGSLKATKVIPFDGAYWYFKWPDTQPAPNATVTQGTP